MALRRHVRPARRRLPRYSVDAAWLVPHFEKMLYDNALLASAYLHGWAVTRNERYRQVAEDTLDHLLREMRLPEGVFASAQDADTDGHEGLTYVWTPQQLHDLLGKDDGDATIAYYGLTEEGNFEGANVLRPSGPAPGNLDEIRARLFEARTRRSQPARDDKAVCAWNALAISALAESGWRLGREDHLAAAIACAAFMLDAMADEQGGVRRSYRAGDARIAGFLDDHAGFALALLDLHTATGQSRWLAEALRLAELTVGRFHDDENGGFLYAPLDGERLVARHKDMDDNPTPSGQSLMATLLLRVSRLTGRGEAGALEVLQLAAGDARRSPHAFGQLLCALEMQLSPPIEVAVVGAPDDPATKALAMAARAGFHPNAVYAFGDGAGNGAVPLLEGKSLIDGRPAVYVCERFACRAPVTDPAQVAVA